MREISFRAWCTQHNVYMNDITLDTGSSGMFTCEGCGDCYLDEHIVEQFTGLKDKNGKEIYEGDIFPCVYAFDGCTGHNMKVEWNNERSGFFPRWDYAKCHQKGVTKTMHDLLCLEIIGNIHENPELLN